MQQTFISGASHEMKAMIERMSSNGWCVVPGTAVVFETPAGSEIGYVMERRLDGIFFESAKASVGAHRAAGVTPP